MGRRFAALTCALAIGLCLMCTAFALPAGTGVEKKPTVFYPSLTQLSDYSFMESLYKARVDAGEDPVIVMGSSDLNSKNGEGYQPSTLFYENDYGVDVMVWGHAQVINLNDAITVAALAPEMKTKKIILFPGIQWYMCWRTPKADFGTNYSKEALQKALENPDLSDETKQNLVAYAGRYGADVNLNEGTPTSLEGYVARFDELVGTAKQRARVILQTLVPSSSDATAEGVMLPVAQRDDSQEGAKAAPDFDKLKEDALEVAMSKCTTNDLGLCDTYYNQTYANWQKESAHWNPKKGKEWSKQEFHDFELLLQVCDEAGVELCVVLAPCKGKLYDQSDYTAKVRARYYKKMRKLCKKYDVQCMDYSGYEYNTYFFKDTAHPSEYGATFYSEAVYDFAMGIENTSQKSNVQEKKERKAAKKKAAKNK